MRDLERLEKTRRLFYLLEPQLEYVFNDSKILGVEKGRQLGFTWISAAKILRINLTEPKPQDHWWISRDEFTAKLFLQDFLHWLNILDSGLNHKKEFKATLIDMKNDVSALRIKLPVESATGPVYLNVMSSSVNAIAGKRGHIWIDEAALHKDFQQLYDIAKPATRWGGNITFFSTHRSKQNYFYKLIEKIKSGEIPDAQVMTIKLDKMLDNGYLRILNDRRAMQGKRIYANKEEFLEEERAQSSSEEMFLQENFCVPADSEAVQAIQEDDLRRIMRPQIDIFKSPRSTARYYAGIDVGRNRDLTVFWVVEDCSTSTQPLLITRYVETMSKTRFSEQESKLAALLKKWKPRKCLIDGTNVGEGLAEALEERFSCCEKIKITRTTRPVWISNLIAFTRRDRTCLHVPDTNEVWEDFMSVERYINKEGKEDFFIPSHKERGHGDRFMSLVLCLQAFASVNSLARYTLKSEGTLTPSVKSQKEIENMRPKRNRALSF